MVEDKRFAIERCEYLPGISEAKVWEIIKIRGNIGIQCNPWVLILQQVKLEGKKSIDIKDFVNGYPGFVGSILK
jgi:methionyl-tRNA formyltransferase